MAERLKNTLPFNLAAGASVVLPHGLVNSSGRPLEPDIVYVPDANIAMTASSDISVTLKNNNADAVVAGAVLVESWHTIERAFGDVADTDLAVKPYVVLSVGNSLLDGFATRGPAPLFSTSQQPAFPTIPQSGDFIEKVIYARTTGNDTTGDGKTPGTAYRTFERAILDVPNLIDVGYTYTVDITDLGLETLPQDYTLPCIYGCAGTWPDPTPPAAAPYLGQTGMIKIRALPKLATTPNAQIVAADGATVAALGPGLTRVTVAGANFALTLAGKQVAKSAHGREVACTIFANTATTLDLCNTPADFNVETGGGTGIGALFLGAGETLDILEPSATLDAPASPVKQISIDFGGVCAGLVLQGIKIPSGTTVGIARQVLPVFEMCDLGFVTFADSDVLETQLFASTIRDGVATAAASISMARSYWPPGLTPSFALFFSNTANQFVTTVIEGAAHIGYTADDNAGFQAPSLAFKNCWFIDSVESAISMVGPARLDMLTCQIDGSLAGDGAGDAIHLDGLIQATITGVTGTGNANVGVFATNGAMVDIGAATTVTGTAGDVQSGSLAVAAYAALPQYDLPPDAASLAVATGTRIY